MYVIIQNSEQGTLRNSASQDEMSSVLFSLFSSSSGRGGSSCKRSIGQVASKKCQKYRKWYQGENSSFTKRHWQLNFTNDIFHKKKITINFLKRGATKEKGRLCPLRRTHPPPTPFFSLRGWAVIVFTNDRDSLNF